MKNSVILVLLWSASSNCMLDTAQKETLAQETKSISVTLYDKDTKKLHGTITFMTPEEFTVKQLKAAWLKAHKKPADYCNQLEIMQSVHEINEQSEPIVDTKKVNSIPGAHKWGLFLYFQGKTK